MKHFICVSMKNKRSSEKIKHEKWTSNKHEKYLKENLACTYFTVHKSSSRKLALRLTVTFTLKRTSRKVFRSNFLFHFKDLTCVINGPSSFPFSTIIPFPLPIEINLIKLICWNWGKGILIILTFYNPKIVSFPTFIIIRRHRRRLLSFKAAIRGSRWRSIVLFHLI